MTDICITFKLPYKLIASILVNRRIAQREYRVLLFGGLIGSLCLWFLAMASGFNGGFILAALLFTTFQFSLPLGLRFQANRIAKNLPGVITYQTWKFSDNGICVVNENRQEIISPWNMVKAVDNDDLYLYLVDKDGGRSPIPINILNIHDIDYIKEKVLNSQVL